MAANTYFDPTKLAAAIAAQGAGADGRTVLTGKDLLSVLTNVNAPTYHAASQRLETHGQDDPTTETDPAYYQDSAGNILSPVDGAQFGDPNGQYFVNSLENPSSTGGKDQAQVTYKINPDGTASPIAANNQYQPSGWVDSGRLITELGATLATAGAAGAYLGGGAAVGGAGGAGGTTAAGTGGGLLGGSSVPVSGGVAGASGTTGGLGSQIGAYTAANSGDLAAAGGAAGGAMSPAELASFEAGGLGGAGSASTVASNPGFWSSLAAGNYGDAASSGLSSVGNYLATPGGVQTAAGLLGAAAGAAGAKGGLNSATTTQQNTVDPRVAQYVYGANGTSGLLGDVNNTLNSQLATGGLNANQTAGLNMQLAALNDPAYASSLQQQRTTGVGLLSAPQASNPFTSGAASLSPQANSQIQGSAMPPGFQPMATQLNPQRPASPNMTGLLGNLRPYGA